MRIAVLRVADRRAMVPMLALGLLLGAAGRAGAGPLNPLDFPSLGAFPTASGFYTFNTSGTPTLTGPGGTNLTGVVFNGIAVFDFDSINIPTNQAFAASGALPLALLSRTNVTIAGLITGGGDLISGGPGGGSGPILPFTPGGGPGGGGGGHDSQAPFVSTGGGGGGFGGPGGAGASSVSDVPGGLGGTPYGDLAQQLQGGSGGGTTFSFGPGAGGGGAIEIGAVGSLLISGSILAGGRSLTETSSYGGGGGSGGGIFLHADSVLLTGSLNAVGGAGAPAIRVPGPGGRIIDAGGGGGGGRVTILFGPGGYTAGSGATINVAGGAGGLGGQIGADGSPGGAGVIDIAFVPEPASVFSMAVGLLGLLGYGRHHRKRARA